MDKYLQFGTYTQGCPEWLLDKVKALPKDKVDGSYIEKVLEIIKQEFDPKLHEITTTHDFKTSRFINVADVLEKRQRSCGSMVTVVASVLRTLGIPTKLINGKFIKNNPNMKHAWVEVLINDWTPFDIMQRDFKLTPYHIRIDEWIDWSDLEKTLQ